MHGATSKDIHHIWKRSRLRRRRRHLRTNLRRYKVFLLLGWKQVFSPVFLFAPSIFPFPLPQGRPVSHPITIRLTVTPTVRNMVHMFICNLDRR